MLFPLKSLEMEERERKVYGFGVYGVGRRKRRRENKRGE